MTDAAFLHRTIAANTWEHHYEPKTKHQSMEYYHKDSPTKNGKQNTGFGYIAALNYQEFKGTRRYFATTWQY